MDILQIPVNVDLVQNYINSWKVAQIPAAQRKNKQTSLLRVNTDKVVWIWTPSTSAWWGTQAFVMGYADLQVH